MIPSLPALFLFLPLTLLAAPDNDLTNNNPNALSSHLNPEDIAPPQCASPTPYLSCFAPITAYLACGGNDACRCASVTVGENCISRHCPNLVYQNPDRAKYYPSPSSLSSPSSPSSVSPSIPSPSSPTSLLLFPSPKTPVPGERKSNSDERASATDTHAMSAAGMGRGGRKEGVGVWLGLGLVGVWAGMGVGG